MAAIGKLHHKIFLAYSSVSLIIICGIFVIVSIFIGKTLGFNILKTALVSFLISHIVAGILGAYFVQRLFHNKLWDLTLVRDVVVGILIIYLINHLISLFNISVLTQFITTSVIYIIIGIIIFKFVKNGWLAELKSKLYA